MVGQHDDDSSGRSMSQSPALSHDASSQTLSFGKTGRVTSCIECSTTSFEYSPPASGSRSDQDTDDRSFVSFAATKRTNGRATTTTSSGEQTLTACCPTGDGSGVEEPSRFGYSRLFEAEKKTQANGDGRKQSLGGAAKRVTPPIENRSSGGGSCTRASSPSVRSAQVRQLATGLPVAVVPPSSGGDWRGRLASSSGGGTVEGTMALPVLTRQHGQLVAAMLRLLAADKIDLSQPPYTSKVSGNFYKLHCIYLLEMS